MHRRRVDDAEVLIRAGRKRRTGQRIAVNPGQCGRDEGGVMPLLPARRTSAPLARSSAATRVLSQLTARRSGVSPNTVARLDVGATIAGSAIVEQFDATTVIPQGWTARVDGYRNLILERNA